MRYLTLYMLKTKAEVKSVFTKITLHKVKSIHILSKLNTLAFQFQSVSKTFYKTTCKKLEFATFPISDIISKTLYNQYIFLT